MKSVAFTALAALALSTAARADLSISNKPTRNVSCNADVCTATAKGANLNVKDLTNMLASADTTVKTGGGAITIQVLDGFSWTSASRLTLDAEHTIGIHQPVAVSGDGALTLTCNDGGSGGKLLFFDAGSVSFSNLSSDLVINGAAYKLEANVKSLAADIAANASAAFALANDYDASSDGQYTDSPVSTPFSGAFDGLGHTVRNLSVLLGPYKTGNRGMGMFRELEQGGSISHVQVDATIETYGKRQDVGVVVGRNYGLVEQVSASGSVHADKSSNGGGAVGRNETTGTLDLSTSSAIVHAGGRLAVVGGLVGENDGLVSASHASGRLTGNDEPTGGGLVGNNTGQILTSSAEMKIDLGNTDACGGLAGRNIGDIEQSFWTGSLKCQGWPDSSPEGGLVGGTTGGTIANDYALGSVEGVATDDVAGGLLGAIATTDVSASYAVGRVAAPKAAGGFAGSAGNWASFARDYWDTDAAGGLAACGEGVCKGVKGLTDKKMKSALPKGFDPQIWAIDPKINSGYPYLLANPPQ